MDGVLDVKFKCKCLKEVPYLVSNVIDRNNGDLLNE